MRTVETCAAFLLPYLQKYPDIRILDVGCGPGSISCDLAEIASKSSGSVVAVDISASVLEEGKALANNRKLENIAFQQADVMKGLPFKDNEFDVVYTHQVLVHLPNPVNALRELKRVCKIGGIVACREGDSHVWYPSNPDLESLQRLLDRAVRAGGAEPLAGRRIHAWARQAGFDPDLIEKSVSGSCNSSTVKRESFRVFCHGLVNTGLREKVSKLGGTAEEIDRGLEAVDEWAANKDGWFSTFNGEIICQNN